MFSTTYTVLLSPGREERLAHLKQHINKNIIYIANAQQSSQAKLNAKYHI
jgi:hypothetical protein